MANFGLLTKLGAESLPKCRRFIHLTPMYNSGLYVKISCVNTWMRELFRIFLGVDSHFWDYKRGTLDKMLLPKLYGSRRFRGNTAV